MRGLPRTATAPVPVNDSAPAMAADILNCLENADALRERQELVMRVSHDLRRTNGYVTALARANARPTAAAKARRSLLAEFGAQADPGQPDLEFVAGSVLLRFGIGGNAAPFLGAGWHRPEVWGRWMDGQRATLRLPASLFRPSATVEIRFPDFLRPVRVSISCCGGALTPPGLITRDQSVRFMVDGTMTDQSGDTITLEMRATAAVCPMDLGESCDERVLGAGVSAVAIIEQDR